MMRPVMPLAPGATSAPKPIAQKPPSAEALKAAQQFEALLLRHVLKSLEKTTKIGASSENSPSAYRSMIVDALADGIAQSGGLGLAEMIARSLDGPGFRPNGRFEAPQAPAEPTVHTKEENPKPPVPSVEDKR